MKKITVGVRDFALPAPRVGSIEMNSGYGAAPATGMELHLEIQKQRGQAFTNYRSEVKVNQSFERGDFKFQVTGMIDGIFDGNPATIEEIKSAFDIHDLQTKLTANKQHPYNLQLQTYIYFHLLVEQKTPQAKFLLVSTRNREMLEVPIEFNREDYERWLDLRLNELVIEAQINEDDIVRRKMISRTLTFPFAGARTNQMQLVEAIENSINANEHLLVQAPTGLGKTVAVTFPTLKDALSKGQKLIYVTPKNSQHSVAEDAVKRFQKKQPKLRGLTITAKSKLCLKEEQLCQPEYCEFALNHYEKVAENDLVNKLMKRKYLTASDFTDTGKEYKVCPFELSIECIPRTDVVIGDYNYVFSPRSLVGRFNAPTASKKDKANLVIDEAHNLPARAADYYSGALSTRTIAFLQEEIKQQKHSLVSEALQLTMEAQSIIRSYKPAKAPHGKIDKPLVKIIEHSEKLKELLSRYLNSTSRIEQKDPLLKLYTYWSEFTATLGFEGDNFFTTYNASADGDYLKVTCCDASEPLKEVYDSFSSVIAFSATLKPFDYYSKLSGLQSSKLKSIEFNSPFPKLNRKLLVIPQVSTRYSDRERNYKKIAQAIEKITSLRRGNYFVFFPSFAFLEAVSKICSYGDFDLIKQTPDMRMSDVSRSIETLKLQHRPTLVFAVQGGVFSEGVDYPGESIIGAIIVGPALPNFNLERELLREYYERSYGSGFEYAYTYPAMAKVVQSAGRVIRSETERGLIVLLDKRFIEPNYVKTMPNDWFDNSIEELVSKRILADIAEFWETRVGQNESIA